MRLLLNSTIQKGEQKIAAHLYLEDILVATQQDYITLKDILKLNVTAKLVELLRYRVIPMRLLLNLDSEEEYQQTLHCLPLKTNLDNYSTISASPALESLTFHFVNCQLTHPISVASLRTTLTQYVTCNNIFIRFKQTHATGFKFDSHIKEINVEQSTLYYAQSYKVRNIFNVSDNSYLELLTDIPLYYQDPAFNHSDTLLIYVPDDLKNDTEGVYKLATKIAVRSNALRIKEQTEILLISSTQVLVGLQTSTVNILDDTSEVQLYYSPLGIVSRLPGQGRYESVRLDSFTFNHNIQAYGFLFPLNYCYFDLKTPSSYHYYEDITYLVQKQIKDLSQSVL